jgi:predicted RNase H-like HicB family nuclease
MTYRIHLERDMSGAWVARCPDVPGFHTYGRSLRQVRNRVREALGLWVDDADTTELEFRYHFPSEWRGAIRAYQQARTLAINAERQAQIIAGYVASDLSGHHRLSMRDTAELLGLSHQRVQQLVTERRDLESLSAASRQRVERLTEFMREAHEESEARQGSGRTSRR